MDTLLDAYREEDDDDSPPETTTTTRTIISTTSITESHIQNDILNDSTTSPSEDDLSIDHPKSTNNISEEEENPHPKKQKTLSSLPDSNGVELATPMLSKVMRPSSKKTKKKNTTNSVWTKSTSRKGKKKTKPNNPNTPSANGANEDRVLITPVPRLPEKTDDTPDMGICLSKVHKAEKVELSDDRLAAGSSKGYRMVRATRGVMEGAWYFEIRVLKLGDTGHTRLGWSNEKGDLQAPVGYDSNSFGYRDVDGSKVHKALREKYGEEGYKEGDVIGFYINLPEGGLFAPKPPHLVWYKGQKFICAPDAKEDPPKIVPGSEISFFKNGVCQGVAFSDLFGGRYYPAASMYTMPNEPNCVVKFNFGPDFEFFPENLDGRSVPKPMIEVPYHGYDSQVENGVPEEKNL